MTDQGRGYGSQPWNPTEPGYGEQAQQQPAAPQAQQGYPQQGQYVPQQPVPPQQQGPYAQGRFVPQGGYQQQQQPDPYAQQQWQQQQAYQQQFVQQQGYQQQPQHQQQPQQQQYVQQPVQQAAPVAPQPAGPGPDGIDWEAEAAALENPGAAGTHEGHDPYDDELYVEDGEYAETDEEAEYVEGEEEAEYVDGEYAYAEDEHGEESFFGEQDDSREAERKRKVKGKKSGRRNGGACLLVALVLLGGLGGAGWWGYGFYQKNFGPPADYAGAGAGKVQIQIKDGSSATEMAQVLKDAGVVKSVGAFNNAYTKAGKVIQPGYYYMALQMSGDSAVQMMVTEAGGDSLIIPEGKKASDIYALIDGKLKLDKGTTANAAKSQAGSLGLPAYANNNPEGFLWPTKYSVSQGMKPEDLLKQMVGNAVNEYTTLGLDANAQKVGLKTAYDVITEASILQAEGNNTADFGKMARVINNRLTTDVTHHTLGMDTTLQYSVGSKTLTSQQIADGSNKYNTYINKGLPPTPISNPGEDAIKAVLDPTPGTWAYFIAMSPTETRFSTSPDEFKANVKEYCTANGKGFDAASTTCK